MAFPSDTGSADVGRQNKEKSAPKRRGPLRRLFVRGRAFLLRAQGFSGRSARKWAWEIDFESHNRGEFTKAEIKQAHSWGYLASTARDLGITDESRVGRVSERDYLYLRPMNGTYDKWLRDQVSARMVLHDFNDLFEPCHFHVIRRSGQPFLIQMSSEAQEFSPDAEGLRAFLLTYGPMTITRAAWSRSVRWTIAANEEVADGFLLEDVALTSEELFEWMRRVSRRYSLVIVDTSFAGDALEELAPGAETRLRVRMINALGDSPCVGQALIELVYTSGFELRDTEAELESALDLSEDMYVQSLAEDPSEDEGDPDEAGADADENEADAVELTAEEVQPKAERQSRARIRRLVRRRRRRVRKLLSEVDEQGHFAGLVRKGYEDKGEESIVHLTSAPRANCAFAGEVPHWDKICELLKQICLVVPQVEFAEYELAVGRDGFQIVGVRVQPAYSHLVAFSPAVNEFLASKVAAKRETYAGTGVRVRRFFHNLRLKIRRTWAKLVAPRGLVAYQSTRWPRDVMRDLVSKNGLSLSQKRWAYKYGFLSYRIPQYGITPENRTEFISDFEYRWLRHINCKYKYWFEDKVTLKHIAAEFSGCFPDYYYFTSLKNGENRVIAMMDLPEGFQASYDDILRLARERGVLALKPDEGSHGEGFYKLSWDGEHYALNGEPASDEQVLAVLENPKNQYLVTEYIQMHPLLREIYPESVNTIRMTVFKRDGRTPQIGNAYMRIGSSRTGVVDNVAAGGIVAAVDIKTGRFGNAQILDGVDQGNLVPCPVHPDTGVRIEGVLPHWELACELVLSIAAAIPQIEYFGFDVAITEDGIKIPEINRFPDLPRIDTLTPETIEYLLERLEAKKHLYGYDVKPCKKLLRLPER